VGLSEAKPTSVSMDETIGLNPGGGVYLRLGNMSEVHKKIVQEIKLKEKIEKAVNKYFQLKTTIPLAALNDTK